MKFRAEFPELVSDRMQQYAQEKGITRSELLRRFVQLGFVACEIEKSPGEALILHRPDRPDTILKV